MEFGILHHQYPLHVPTIYSTDIYLQPTDYVVELVEFDFILSVD